MTALRRALVGVAWLFAAGSLAALVLVLVLHWPGPGSRSAIMAVTAGGRDHVGLGLRYQGVPGLVLAAGEAVAVLAGIVLSLRRGPGPRRVGHGILITWAALWLGDAVYLSIVAAGGLSALVTAALLAAALLTFTSTVARAGRWPRDREPAAPRL